MKLFTYNILAPHMTDFQLREGISPSFLELAHRLPLILKQLKESDADVICLQEVEQNVFVLLQEALPSYLGVLKPHKFGFFGNATFVRGLNFRYSGLTFNDHSGRRALLVELEDSTTIANVHLDFNSNARQVEQLLAAKDITIICGDFNAQRNSQTLQYLQQQGFVFKETPPTRGHQTIDFICAKPNQIVSTTTLVPTSSSMPDETHGSDHTGILAVLK